MSSVKHLTINGEQHPLKIGYKTLKRLQEDTKGAVDINNIKEFEIYEKILFYGLQQGYSIEKKEFLFQQSDMEDLLEDCFLEFMELIPQFFQKEEDIKKKVEGSAKK